MATVILSMYLSASSPGSEEFAFPSHHLLAISWSARVTLDSSGKFGYYYRVKSAKSSSQTVDSIWLDQEGDVEPTIVVPSAWVRSSRFLPRNASVVWRPGVHAPEGRADRTPVNSVGPGQTSPEFGIIDSPYPPGLNGYEVRGYAPPPVYDEDRNVIIMDGVEYDASEWADDIMDTSTELANTNIADDGLIGFTLGPRTPPTESAGICNGFLDLLSEEIDSAVALGWILPDGAEDAPRVGGKSDKSRSTVKQSSTANFIRGKLTAARGQCKANNYEAASRSIAAALEENCYEWKSKINDEAYQLIRFNGEYILEKFGHPELALSCEPPIGSLRVHVTTRNASGNIVNAQGIEVTVTSKDGAIVKTGKTGWGASSGVAVFEDLPAGEYNVKVAGKATAATVSRDDETKAEVGP